MAGTVLLMAGTHVTDIVTQLSEVSEPWAREGRLLGQCYALCGTEVAHGATVGCRDVLVSRLLLREGCVMWAHATAIERGLRRAHAPTAGQAPSSLAYDAMLLCYRAMGARSCRTMGWWMMLHYAMVVLYRAVGVPLYRAMVIWCYCIRQLSRRYHAMVRLSSAKRYGPATTCYPLYDDRTKRLRCMLLLYHPRPPVLNSAHPQLYAAIGKEISSEDFAAFKRFHNRKLFREDAQVIPAPYSPRTAQY
eukprot:2890662-Rhodomonas_salina.4